MFRIMIADRDNKYCLILQSWFLENYGELVDLEVITDVDYYRSVFETRHEINLLLVSRDFYNAFSPGEFAGKVIVLEESNSHLQSDSVNNLSVDKYADTELIFRTVANYINTGAVENNGKKITTKLVLVTSASGGVGKTTIALGLCSSLSRMGKRVLYMDAEYLQTFGLYLEDGAPIADDSFYEIFESGQPIQFGHMKRVIRKQGFFYLPPLRKPLISIDRDISVFTDMMRTALASKEYDYVLVDSGKEYSVDKARWMSMSDVVVLVTEHDARCKTDYQMLRQEIVDFTPSKYYMICNKVENDIVDTIEGDDVLQLSVKKWNHTSRKSLEELGINRDILKICFLL